MRDDKPRDEQPDTASEPRQKRRRWPYVLIGVAIVLVGLVLTTPYIISTGPGTSLATRIVNSKIRGTVAIGDLSVGWWGPTRLTDVRVLDLQGRVVLRVEEVTVAPGAWGLITDPEAFENLQVVAPRAELYHDEEGRVSLARALESKVPREPRPEKPLPAPRGAIDVRGGAVRYISADDRSYTVGLRDARWQLDTLSRIEGDLTLVSPDRATLTLTIDVTDLVRDGKFDFAGAGGSFDAKMSEPWKLGPIADLFRPDAGVTGTVDLQAHGGFEGESLLATFIVAGKDLQSGPTGGVVARPVDLTLDGNIETAFEELTGQVKLTGRPGTIDLILSPLPLKGLAAISAEQAMSMIFAGAESSLPKANVSATGQFDLGELAAAVPRLMQTGSDARITAGKVQIERFALTAGEYPAAGIEAGVTGLTVERGGRVSSWQPIEIAFDGKIEQGKGLNVAAGTLETGFAKAFLAGPIQELRGGYDVDLALMRERLGELTDLGGVQLAGRAEGSMDLEPAERGRRIVFRAGGKVTDFRYAAEGRRMTIARGDMTARGELTTDQGRVTLLVLEQLDVRADDALALGATATWQPPAGAFEARMVSLDAGLAPVLTYARTLGVIEGAADYSGRISGTASARRESADAPIASDGSLRVADFRADRRLVGDGSGELVWENISFDPNASTLRAPTLRLVSAPATLRAEGLTVRFGEAVHADGDLSLSADVAESIAAVAPLAGWDDPPRLAGKLQWAGRARSQDQRVSFNGEGAVTDLIVGGGEKSFREDRLAFAHEVTLSDDARKATVEKFTVDGDMASFDLSGTVTELRTRRIMDLSGGYTGDWEKIVILLHELAPGTAGRIAFTGESSGDIAISGPASKPEVRPTYRGVDASTAMGWDTATLWGVSLTAARLTPKLADGRVELPAATIDAADGVGKVHLGGTVDLTGDEPVLHMPGSTGVLQRVAVSRELTRDLLTRVNPMFAEMTDIHGKISLDVRDLVLPLSDTILDSGSGSGSLDLSEMNVEPKGAMLKLLQLAGIGEKDSRRLAVSGADFIVRDGRVHYDNFRMSFSEGFDLLFYGSVGFDDTVDLTVSVPVTAGLLERLGATGPVVEYARLLEGARIGIPVSGTRMSPKLDMSKVDIKPLIRKATEGLLKKEAGNVLRDVLEGAKDGQKTTQPADEDQGEPTTAPGPTTESALGGLLDVFLNGGSSRRPSQLPGRTETQPADPNAAR